MAKPVELSCNENAVLEMLITHNGRILSRKYIEEGLYG